ncbi:MAG: hypothetical protein CMJ49_14210 [Planctomycetaceae bacterium]|nr:hypothetical protein [Planctomycetaceae bacterium]
MTDELPALKILLVHAHPADIAAEGAGTVVLHTRRGDDVTCLVCSDGERHHNNLIYREYAKPPDQCDPKVLGATVDDICAFKRREAERICDVLGIRRLYAFGWPDVQWVCTHEKIMQIAEVVREVRPDVVLTHMPWGEQQSQLTDVHAVVGHMTRMAVRYCSDSLPQVDGHEPHHTKLIFYFPMLGMADTNFMFGTGNVCDVWLDITPVVDKKVEALDVLVSQGYEGSMGRKLVAAREGRWGMICGCSYAEPWMRDRAVRYAHLPVRPEDLTKKYVPNDLPGDQMLCHQLPQKTPPDAYDFPLS